MSEFENLWHIGASDAPLPPTVVTEKVGNNLKFYLEQYQTYGPIFRVPRQDKFQTILAGPEANVFMARAGTETLSHHVFWKDFDEKISEKQRSREGEANRQRRAGISHSYSRGRILDRLPFLVETTQEFTSTWEPGQHIAFYPWVQRLVAKQLGQLLTHHEPGEYFPDLVTFLRTVVSTTIMKQQGQTALQSPDYLQARQRIFELGRAIVAEHRLSPPVNHQPDLVDDVIAAATKSGHEVANDQLAMAALGPFLAGLDTVSTASSYLLYALLKHQEVLKRVQAEVNTLQTQKEFSWEQLKTMSALHGAAMETLRLYSLPTGHACQAIQPFTFADYRIERDDDVFVAITVSHFLPELFPDPMHFDIDRYSNPRNEHRQHGAYAPFGIGDRSCLGAGIAELQLMIIIATLLSLFQLELDPPDCKLLPLEKSPISLRDDFGIRVGTRR